MELLVVIAVLLIITVVAIPNIGGMKMEANENSAIQGLRSIYEAETKYQSTYPLTGFACSLKSLGGKAGSGTPSPQGAQVLPDDLSSGSKSGYNFSVASCTKPVDSKHDQYTSFEVTAVPTIPGKTGHRGFCIDQQGEVKADPAGGTNCTVSLQ